MHEPHECACANICWLLNQPRQHLWQWQRHLPRFQKLPKPLLSWALGCLLCLLRTLAQQPPQQQLVMQMLWSCFLQLWRPVRPGGRLGGPGTRRRGPLSHRLQPSWHSLAHCMYIKFRSQMHVDTGHRGTRHAQTARETSNRADLKGSAVHAHHCGQTQSCKP